MRDINQLKMAIQDLLLEIDIFPSDLIAIAAHADYARHADYVEDNVGVKITVRTAQKLLDADITEV